MTWPKQQEALVCRQLRALGPWDRHKVIMQGLSTPSPMHAVKTDADTLREHHQFIREDAGDVGADATWGERLAAKYYNRLLKEYAVCDLHGYKEGKVGLRWRTEQEVVTGKGHFECGSLHCSAQEGLQSYEVPFKYVEQGSCKQVCSSSGAS